MNKIIKFHKDESGAELMELAAYAGIFIVFAIVGLTLLGPAVGNFFGTLSPRFGF
jgi:Flp pilus assembly pilin Flp